MASDSRVTVHPFAGTIRLRGRELMRRPVVATAVLIQIGVLIAVELIEVLQHPAPEVVTRDLVQLGLRTAAAPGGLIFGVLAAAVVGSEFTWATERALLSRDPRRLRFVALQLCLVTVMALAWAAVQSLFAAGLGLLLQAQTGPGAAGFWTPAHGGALLAVLAVTEVYGLLGELGLAPLWEPADGWTLYASAAELVERQGGASVIRPMLVVVGVGVIALAAGLTLYANREVTH